MKNAVLDVRHLNIFTRNGHQLVRDVSFALNEGESLGLVGESGSGKTMTLRSLMGLLPPGMHSESELMRVDSQRAMVFQDPIRALDPMCPVFRQVCEVITCRQHLPRSEAKRQAMRLFDRLDLPADLTAHDRRPSELSGGQCQRVVIAMALSCKPHLLLCDEPTTALDVTVQRQTLQLIADLQRENGFGMVFVTHNLAVAAQMCHHLMVMRAGQVVESGNTARVLTAPASPYTATLLDAVLPVPGEQASPLSRVMSSTLGCTGVKTKD